MTEVAAGSVSRFDPWRHRFALLLVASTLALIFIGGLVTSTESGLAVPDWPLSYGMVMPPMVGGVFYEHGHRMAASLVGFLTLVLALWTWRREPRAGVRKLGWAALLAVCAQGLLGGLTVIFLLPTAVSMAHACLAQTFFLLTIAMAFATSREWLGAPMTEDDGAGLRPVALAVTAVVYVQLLIGASCAISMPASPFRTSPRVRASCLRSATRASRSISRTACGAGRGRLDRVPGGLRAPQRRWSLHRPAPCWGCWCGAGVAGRERDLDGKAISPHDRHVATGAAVLGLSFFLTLRTRRHLRPRAAEAGVPVAVGS